MGAAHAMLPAIYAEAIAPGKIDAKAKHGTQVCAVPFQAFAECKDLFGL